LLLKKTKGKVKIKTLILVLCLNFIIVQNLFPQEIFLVDTSKVNIQFNTKQSNLFNSIKKRASSDRVTLIKSEEINKIKSLNEIGVEIFDKGVIKFKSKNIEKANENTTIWTGENNGNHIILVFTGVDIIGSITIQNEKFKIEPLGGGIHVLIKFDETKLPPEHPKNFENEFSDTLDSNGENKLELDSNINKLYKVNTTTTITMLVAYTQSAANASGNISGLIQLAVAESNQSYSNSDVSINLNLVHTVLVDYIESGDFYTDRDRFMNPSDGYMDNIHSLRNQYSADVCVLIINNDDYCGLAAAIKAVETTAFCVVHYDCATGYYSFAHEIGHLQGARHDRGVDPNETPFRYGHGFIYPSGYWRTIMAYATYCSGCTRIQYWSNPDKTYNNVAMGTEQYEDNARVLDETANDVANFRVPATSSGTLSGNETWYYNSLTGNIYVPAGITLTIKNGATINLNGHYIVSTGGTITIEPGVNIIGHRAIVSTPSSVMGVYPLSYTIQQLINLSSSGWSINLVPGTYIESLNMKSGVTVNGSGPGTTTINGTVTFDNDSYASLTNCTVNNKITILSNSSGVTLSDITAGSSSCYLDVTGPSAYVNNFNSDYSQSYSIWVNNASLFTMGLGSLTNKYNALIVDYSTSGYTNSVNFCENTRDILAGFESGSVSATECSFSSSTEGASVQGNVTWDYWNYCGGSFSMILGKLSGTLNTSPDYEKELKKYAILMEEIRKRRKTEIDLDLKNYKEAFTKVIEGFRSIIRNKPVSNEAKSSIGHIASIYRMLDEYEMLENFANEIINDSQKESLRYYVLRALVLSYINQKKFTHAIELTDQIISKYPNDASVIEMIYYKGLVYKYYLKDEEKAKEMFEKVIRMDSEHVAAVFSRAELEAFGEEFRSNKLLSSEISKEIEIRNYPNPFNPETKIKYSIPETGLVTIKVYDMLGKEITTLVNERKSVGTHEVKFNGSELPSGIYFYSINHGKQRLTGKMMLLK